MLNGADGDRFSLLHHGAYAQTFERGVAVPLYAIGDRRPEVAPDAWVAPSADLIGDVRLSSRTSVWFNAVIRADNGVISIGVRSNVQEGAMLHSDADPPCRVGEDCTIGHHAILHGCTIGNRVLVGMRATILDGALIGEDSIVGAGALVTRGHSFAPRQLILGVPAVAVRELAVEEIADLREAAAHYVAHAAEFANTLVECGRQ